MSLHTCIQTVPTLNPWTRVPQSRYARIQTTTAHKIAQPPSRAGFEPAIFPVKAGHPQWVLILPSLKPLDQREDWHSSSSRTQPSSSSLPSQIPMYMYITRDRSSEISILLSQNHSLHHLTISYHIESAHIMDSPYSPICANRIYMISQCHKWLYVYQLQHPKPLSPFAEKRRWSSRHLPLSSSSGNTHHIFPDKPLLHKTLLWTLRTHYFAFNSIWTVQIPSKVEISINGYRWSGSLTPLPQNFQTSHCQ